MKARQKGEAATTAQVQNEVSSFKKVSAPPKVLLYLLHSSRHGCDPLTQHCGAH